MIVNVSKDYFDKGVFLFENGNYIFIEEVEYSGDGTYWESQFEPLDHPDPRNLNSILLGHKYRRVRHAGDDYFQKPMKWVPDNGLTPVFKVENNKLYQKYITQSDTSYIEIFDVELIRGAVGAKGEQGTGLHIDSAGYYNKIPACSMTTVNASTCLSCNPNAPNTNICVNPSVGNTFLCLGKSDGTDAIEGVLSVDSLVLASPVIGEHVLSYGGKIVTFTEINAENLATGIIYIGEEIRSRGTVTMTVVGLAGNIANLLVDGNVVSSYTVIGTETLAQVIAGLVANMSGGYTALAFGVDSMYVYCPTGSGSSGNSRILTLVSTGTNAGTVVSFTNGVTKGAQTISEQVNKILAITAPASYNEEGIVNGVVLTRNLLAGSIDGNLIIGNTGVNLVHTIVVRGIEAIANVVDIRYPGEVAGPGQVGAGLRGNVYICTEVGWVLMSNISAPVYKLAPNQTYATTMLDGLYMEEFVVPTYIINGDDGGTIALDLVTNKLDVKTNSLEPKHFKDDIFSDGFEEGTVGIEGYKSNNLFIKPLDFSGFGLKTYASVADGYYDIQVDVTNLLGDGLTVFDNNGLNNTNSVDGEDRLIAIVLASDLVDVTKSGLMTFVNTDSYLDLKVFAGKGILVDHTGTSVDTDELSITGLTTNKVRVKPYAAGNDGILGTHLNPNAANILKGLKVDNATGIEIILSTDHKALDFDVSGLKLTNHTIEGWHLNHNIADASSGAIMMNETTDLLEVLVKTSGGIIIDGANGLAIDTTDLSWLDVAVVKKIEVWENTGINYQGDVKGDIVLEGDTVSDNYMDINVIKSGQTIVIKPETNLANLQALITSTVGTGVAVHTHVISDITALQTALDTKVEKDVALGNMKITTTGIYLQSPSGVWFKLGVDDNGDIITT